MYQQTFIRVLTFFLSCINFTHIICYLLGSVKAETNDKINYYDLCYNRLIL